MAWWQRQFGNSTRGRIVALLRRAERSVEELARVLGLTDNAIRAQLIVLQHHGIVHKAEIRRDGAVGQPATLYGVAADTSALFSGAYAPLLSSLLVELSGRMSRAQLDAVLCSAGRRLAPVVPPDTAWGDRVRAGAAFLVELGADADLVTTSDGYEIRSHGCILSDAVTACPATCRAVEAVLSDIAGVRVGERCERTPTPKCRFLIPSESTETAATAPR